MKILIIRHGEPDYSIDSLTPKGWREADLLADRLSGMDIADFYVSPMGRARDTAKATLERVNREAEVLPWLHEFRGVFLNPRDGRREYPWDLMPQYWTKQPELFEQDGWRRHGLFRTGDMEEIYDEMANGLDALLARYGYVRDGMIYRCDHNDDRTIALFCHFGIAMAMLAHLTGIALPLLWQGFILPTTSVTTLITEERVKGEVWFRCRQLGDTSHLYAAGEPVSRAGLYTEVYGKEEPWGAK